MHGERLLLKVADASSTLRKLENAVACGPVLHVGTIRCGLNKVWTESNHSIRVYLTFEAHLQKPHLAHANCASRVLQAAGLADSAFDLLRHHDEG